MLASPETNLTRNDTLRPWKTDHNLVSQSTQAIYVFY